MVSNKTNRLSQSDGQKLWNSMSTDMSRETQGSSIGIQGCDARRTSVHDEIKLS